MLLKSMVKAWPEGAARQLWSNATPMATTVIVVPEGLHPPAVVGAMDGWDRGGVVKARAKPPVGDVATLRLALSESNQAMATFLPSSDTAREGLVPSTLSNTGVWLSAPGWPVASITRWATVSV